MLVAGALQAQAASPPPVSSELPTREETAREQIDVVPSARTAEAQERLADVPVVMLGKLVEADARTRTLTVATDGGLESVRLSPGAQVRLNGRPVQGLSSLPQGVPVRATYRSSASSESLDVAVSEAPNGPAIRSQGRGEIPIEP
jgi:hypothetical protein